jgi:hypothetical protein
MTGASTLNERISDRALDVCIETYSDPKSIHATQMRSALLELRQRRLKVGSAGQHWNQIASGVMVPVKQRCGACNGRGVREQHTISTDTCDGEPGQTVHRSPCPECAGLGSL